MYVCIYIYIYPQPPSPTHVCMYVCEYIVDLEIVVKLNFSKFANSKIVTVLILAQPRVSYYLSLVKWKF